MLEADPPLKRGRLPAVGKRATRAPTGSAGVLRWHVWKRGLVATREALPVAWHAPTDSPRGSGWAGRVAERSVGTKEAG